MTNEINSLRILEKALDATWARNQVISNNIANVDTPNYKAYKVEFEDMLQDAIQRRGITGYRTNPKHIPIGRQPLDSVAPRIVRQRNTSFRLDGNNVDIDTENATLAKNTLMYQALVQQISGKLSRLKSVIKEGGR